MKYFYFNLLLNISSQYSSTKH